MYFELKLSAQVDFSNLLRCLINVRLQHFLREYKSIFYFQMYLFDITFEKRCKFPLLFKQLLYVRSFEFFEIVHYATSAFYPFFRVLMATFLD